MSKRYRAVDPVTESTWMRFVRSLGLLTLVFPLASCSGLSAVDSRERGDISVINGCDYDVSVTADGRSFSFP